MELLSNTISGSINDRKFQVYIDNCQLLKAICATELNNVHYTEIMPIAPTILCMQIHVI
jgi:hypothetical protein